MNEHPNIPSPERTNSSAPVTSGSPDLTHAPSTRRERRQFSPAQKVAIVKRHLLERVPISNLCDEHAITPTQFYQWQKQLFDHGVAAFERAPAASKPVGPSVHERELHQLRAKLLTKNEVIAELMEECLVLKKETGGT